MSLSTDSWVSILEGALPSPYLKSRLFWEPFIRLLISPIVKVLLEALSSDLMSFSTNDLATSFLLLEGA